jgi:hypothetical protein
MKRALVALALVGCLSKPTRPPAEGVARHWTLRLPQSAPGGVASGRLTYDPNRGVLMYDAQRDRIWQLGATGDWIELCFSPCFNPSTNFPGFVYDPGQARALFFGGCSTGTCESQLFAWNGGPPQLLATGTVPPRAEMGFVIDPTTGRPLVIGGVYNGTSFADAWAFDGSSWAQIASPPVVVDFAATGVAADPDHGRVLVFADFDHSTLYELSNNMFSTVCTDCMHDGLNRNQTSLVHIPDYDQTFLLDFGPPGTFELVDRAFPQFADQSGPNLDRSGAAYDAGRDALVFYGYDGTTWELVQ